MPGFKGIERPEFKPGEFKGEKAAEIEIKAAPFIKASAVNPTATSTFGAEGNKGLRSFLEIGETGNAVDWRSNPNLRRYLIEEKNSLEISILPKAPEPIVQQNFVNRGFFSQAAFRLGEFLKKAWEYLGGRMGGGFGGPLMIFGFLLGPKGENGGSAQTPINLKIVNDFQKNLREHFVATGAERYFRDSPSSPLQNISTAYLSFDPKSSEPILSSQPSEGSLPIHAYLDQRNVIFMDPASLQAVRGMLERYPLTEQQRSVLYALTRLQGSPLHIEATPGNDIAPLNSSDGLLPQVSAESVERARQMFMHQSGHSMALMTTVYVSGNPLTQATAISLDLMKGRMYLSETGQVVGLNLSRPDMYSPRGTEYMKGSAQGTPVEIVADSFGNIYHYEFGSEAKQGLNRLQDAKLQAMLNHPKNREAVQRAQAKHPYFVDFALGRGMHPLFSNFSSALGRGEYGNFTIQIYKNGSNYRFVNSQVPSKPSRELPVGVISVNYQPGAAHPQRSWERKPGQFQYQLLQGSLPYEVGQLLNFIQTKVENPSH